MSEILHFIQSTPTKDPLIIGTLLVFSLIVGSFFNVVIHRLSQQMEGVSSKELSTTKPAKSFCPNCKKELSWKENIPLISYIIQLGRCTGCKKDISWRYPAVELTSVIITASVWNLSPSVGSAILGVFFLDVLLLTAVIDAKTKKIPNKLTVPGTVILLAAAFIPLAEGSNLAIDQGKTALIGAVGCFILMWGLAELGKRLFGKKKVVLKKPQAFLWENGTLKIQDAPEIPVEESEAMSGADLGFARPSDRLIIQGDIIQNKAEGMEEKLSEVIISPHESGKIHGSMKTITFPREAMGMGDAKLLLFAGAAMGFLPAIHGLVAGTLAALVGVMAMRVYAIAKKGNAPGLIAFGPWIAIGCAGVWIYNAMCTSCAG